LKRLLVLWAFGAGNAPGRDCLRGQFQHIPALAFKCKWKENKIMESGEIGNIGERHVEAVLVKDGWTCNRNTQLPGSTDIEAVKAGRKILVQVKTAVNPAQPADLSEEETRNIKTRAARTNSEAWLAKATITPAGLLMKDIGWRQV
jgi:hypothetical protein